MFFFKMAEEFHTFHALETTLKITCFYELSCDKMLNASKKKTPQINWTESYDLFEQEDRNSPLHFPMWCVNPNSSWQWYQEEEFRKIRSEQEHRVLRGLGAERAAEKQRWHFSQWEVSYSAETWNNQEERTDRKSSCISRTAAASGGKTAQETWVIVALDCEVFLSTHPEWAPTSIH